MTQGPPPWIAAALALTGIIGLVFMVNPVAGLTCALFVAGTAGLVLFCIVASGKLDRKEGDE